MILIMFSALVAVFVIAAITEHGQTAAKWLFGGSLIVTCLMLFYGFLFFYKWK